MSAVTSFSSPAETCTVHVLHGEGRSESKGKGRRVYLETPQSSSGGQRWRGGSSGAGSVGGSSSVFSSSFLPIFLFFLPLRVFFFSSFSVLSPFSLYSLLSFPLSSLFCFFSPLLFSRALPCIYRKNRGERGRGRPLCNHPKNCPRNTSPPSSPTRGKLRASGVGQRLFKRELAVENRGRKKIFFFPCFARPGEEEDIWCRLKRHHFCFFFFSFFCMNIRWNGAVFPKTRRFI